MSHDGQELRRAAVKSFFESLDKLQTELNDASVQPATGKSLAGGDRIQSNSERSKRRGFDLRELEDAAADIEQFFQQQHQQSTPFME